MRLLLALALFVLVPAASAATQSTPDTALVALVTSDDQGVALVAGTYVGDGVALRVARDGRRLELTLAGQGAFDAFADAPADPSFNARAEALLRDAFAGSTDRLADALPAHRRDAGTVDFARLLSTLADRHGTVESVNALGTTADGDDYTATLVRVRFADGEELLKLRWREGDLALITRGALPTVTAHPVRGDARRFAVLDDAGEPQTLLVFGETSVTAQGAAATLVADRTK
jgi:hypothetical protein